MDRRGTQKPPSRPKNESCGVMEGIHNYHDTKNKDERMNAGSIGDRSCPAEGESFRMIEATATTSTRTTMNGSVNLAARQTQIKTKRKRLIGTSL
jgi:hypothetical protein